MYYELKIRDFVRVPPELFNLETEKAVLESLKEKYRGIINKDLGVVIDVYEIKDISEGKVIPGDGAAYFNTIFKLLVFKPETREIVYGKITNIAEYGIFMNIGVIDGLVHISQAMDDFVNFTKERVLTGKETKRILKVNDICKARIIAVSFKDPRNPKIGLTMRQDYLGKEEWWLENNKEKNNNKSKKKKK